MSDEFLLYISAASDLDALRDALARAVTEIPVTLNWRIVQSPLRDEPLDYAAVRQADLHILALGGDIRAPIGLEWLVARQAHQAQLTQRLPLLFLREDAHRTQAAADFVRHVALDGVWQPFTQIGAVRRLMLEQIGRMLRQRPHFYRLTSAEMEALQTWLEQLDRQNKDVTADNQTVASANSIILSTERFTPSDGVLL